MAVSFPEIIQKWMRFKRGKILPSMTQIAFYGGSFTSLPLEEQRQLLTLALPYIRNKTVGSLRVSARPDGFSPRIVRLLWDFGVRTVELGVQSLDAKVLRLSGRNYPPAEVSRAVSLLHSRGFEIGAQLMPGLPGCTREGFSRTVEETIRLKPHFVRIYPALVIRDTPMEGLYHRGIYSPLSLEQAVEWSAHGLRRFRESGIRVIRIGLQPTEAIRSGGRVVAGPFHPALRQLVESRLALHRMMRLLEDGALRRISHTGKKRTFRVPPRELSHYRGQRNENLVKLDKACQGAFAIVGDPALAVGAIGLDTA